MGAPKPECSVLVILYRQWIDKSYQTGSLMDYLKYQIIHSPLLIEDEHPNYLVDKKILPFQVVKVFPAKVSIWNSTSIYPHLVDFSILAKNFLLWEIVAYRI